MTSLNPLNQIQNSRLQKSPKKKVPQMTSPRMKCKLMINYFVQISINSISLIFSDSKTSTSSNTSKTTIGKDGESRCSYNLAFKKLETVEISLSHT